MRIQMLKQDFSVCKVKDFSMIDLEREFCFASRTDEERSLVCVTGDVPGNCICREDGWRAFRIEGELDFSLVGILSNIAGILAEKGIAIFAISTYNTDYVLLKGENLEKAVWELNAAGYDIQ